MGIFGTFKKRLKNKLRMRRRWLALGALLLAAGFAASFGVHSVRTHEALPAGGELFAFSAQKPASPADVKAEASVTLRKQYVCGEEEKALGILPPERIAQIAAEHPDWEFEAKTDRAVVFTERIDDLSEECKRNAYIGVDATGGLTLFEGPPSEARAVKTFFQLNVEHLESALPEDVVTQLREGIRITDLSDYHSVLSTFSDYAIDETEDVMKTGM